VYIVAAIYNPINETWLLMKRPETNYGLLSGQWEFPSICVWQSDAGDQPPVLPNKNETNQQRGPKKPRVDMSHMIPDIPMSSRRKYLHTLLKERIRIRGCTGSRSTQSDSEQDCSHHQILVPHHFCTVNERPIHHVFSHIRHTLYIEYATSTTTIANRSQLFLANAIQNTDRDTAATDDLDDDDNNNDDDGKTVPPEEQRWMSVSDMENVGITSGVQKILQTVLNFVKHNDNSPYSTVTTKKNTKVSRTTKVA
jgi:adenine-specific DNA glycosylase